MNWLSNLKWWFLHRTFYRFDIVRTGLPFGYHETPERMLEAAFSLLKEHVEIEISWMYYVCHKCPKPWWMSAKHYVKTHRQECLEKYLTYWNGVSEEEAHKGWCMAPETLYEHRRIDKEVLDLYVWWTQTRPKRPDPYEDCYIYTPDSIRAKVPNEVLDIAYNKEVAYDQEDEDMLIRLMKIRNTLWT